MHPLVDAIAAILPVRPAATGAERHPPPDLLSGLAALQVGQSVRGRVLAVSGHAATVLVNDQPVHMELPPGRAMVGDSLKLVYTGTHPNPTFLLTGIDPRGQVPTRLSPAALAIEDLLRDVTKRPATPAIDTPHPLAEETPPLPALVAIRLQTAIARSGLFYESHLAGWVRGERPLASVRQEPQAQHVATVLPPLPGYADDTALAGKPPVGAADGEPVLAPELRPLVAQQLQLLETPALAWRGEVWPGQTMEWQITRHDDAPPRPADAAAPARLSTRMRLELPNLGPVTIFLDMDAGTRFAIRVVPDDAAAANRLRAGQDDIAGRLAGAGCTLTALQVDDHGCT